MHRLDHLERLPRVDRVHEEVPVYAHRVLGGEESVLVLSTSVRSGSLREPGYECTYLPSRVDDLALVCLTLKGQSLVRGRLDCGEVGFVVSGRGDVLLRQGGFA